MEMEEERDGETNDTEGGGMATEAALVVCDVPTEVFTSASVRHEFESLFRCVDPTARFLPLPSFRRVRVTLRSRDDAAVLRSLLHLRPIAAHRNGGGEDKVLRIYHAQPPSLQGPPRLGPPPLEKQLLISPPASPPVGWTPRPDPQPVIDIHLLCAIAGMRAGSQYELQAATPISPSVVIHFCDDDGDHGDGGDGGDDEAMLREGVRGKIVQTKRPPSKHHQGH